MTIMMQVILIYNHNTGRKKSNPFGNDRRLLLKASLGKLVQGQIMQIKVNYNIVRASLTNIALIVMYEFLMTPYSYHQDYY